MSYFHTLGLSADVVSTLTSLGFERPTPVQEEAIPILLQRDCDLLSIAQTGTGKTASFGLPLVEKLDRRLQDVQAVILAPTRELCLQICSELAAYSGNAKDLRIVPVYGGASISEQITKLRRGAHIVVATPGRLMDMLDRKALFLDKVRFAVLDEADEMLNMGFKEDIDYILSHTPDSKNVWLFSATMSPEIRRIAAHYMRDPYEINIDKEQAVNRNITHQYIVVGDRDRYEVIRRLADYHPEMFGLVFCRTKLQTQEVADQLSRDGYKAGALHGDLSQPQRDRVMAGFRNRSFQILIATDVAARGIDVSNVTHVIHMYLPDEPEYYTHRSGRTARAGATGTSISLVNFRELYRIRLMEKKLSLHFEQVPVPTGAQVCERRAATLAERLLDAPADDTFVEPFLPALLKSFEHLSKEDIIRRWIASELGSSAERYSQAPDLNPRSSGLGSRPGSGPSAPSGPYERPGNVTRLLLNVGSREGLDKARLLAFVCDKGNVTKSSLGKLIIKDNYSLVEVESNLVKPLVQRLSGQSVKGRKVRVEQPGEMKPERR